MPTFEVAITFRAKVEAQTPQEADERAMTVWREFRAGGRPVELVPTVDMVVEPTPIRPPGPLGPAPGWPEP